MRDVQSTYEGKRNEPKTFAAARLIQDLDPSVQIMKMQKLLYYVQGWSLALTGDPLIDSSPHAYKDGPVYPVVRKDMKYDGTGKITAAQTSILSDQEAEIIAAVVNHFRDRSGRDLAAATHSESPWQEARGGLPAGESSSEEISLQSMMRHFLSVPASEAISVSSSVGTPRHEPGSDFFQRETAKWSDLIKRLGA